MGKSTLVNSLFLTDLYPERQILDAADKMKQTVKIDASTVEIEERGVKLRLTVVDTPGYGDAINCSDWYSVNIYCRTNGIKEWYKILSFLFLHLEKYFHRSQVIVTLLVKCLTTKSELEVYTC